MTEKDKDEREEQRRQGAQVVAAAEMTRDLWVMLLGLTPSQQLGTAVSLFGSVVVDTRKIRRDDPSLVAALRTYLAVMTRAIETPLAELDATIPLLNNIDERGNPTAQA